MRLDPYESVAVATGVLYVWLVIRESVWCWPVGVVNAALYTLVFWQARLYADMGLQVVYAALCVYGWYEWRRGGKDHGPLRVSTTPPFMLIVLAAAGTTSAVLLGFLLHRLTDASLPFWDSSTTAFSLVAQYMVTRKWLENWVLWIVVNAVYVWMYVTKGLHATAALYVVFLVLAVMGLRTWLKALPAEEA